MEIEQHGLTRFNPKTAPDLLKRDGVRVWWLFVSYSHKDEPYLKEFETHVTPLRRKGEIASWHDRKILPSIPWAEQIDENLKKADIILLFVSPDYIASDSCEAEMNHSLERHKAGEAHVIPVILRDCDWQSTPLGKLQALPKDGKPIKQWRDRDSAWKDVVRGIHHVILNCSKPETR